MRLALHILCIVVVLPYFALAGGFLLFGHAIARGSLLGFFESLLAQAAWLVSWGGFAIAAAVVFVAALGFSARSRWAGAAFVCFIAAGCVIVLLAQSTSTFTYEELLFLVPCIASIVGEGWLAATEWPTRRSFEHAA